LHVPPFSAKINIQKSKGGTMDKEVNQEDIESQKDIEKEDKSDKIYWHDAFYAALQLEFHEYIDDLIFEDERQLSKEALMMDVLIIKKRADVKIDKNIGRILKGHNIFEYKSEKDNLSIWDYNKVIGYAMIYSAFEKIAVDNITINFVVTPKPVKLFKYLEEDRSVKVVEVHPGIYYIEEDTFAIQIIESKKLEAGESVFLRNLRSNLTQQDMKEVFKAYRKYGSLERISAYINRILDANKSVFKEVSVMNDELTVEGIIQDFIKKHDLENKVREEVWEDVKAEVREDIKAEVREDIKAEVREGIKAEVREDVKAEMREDIHRNAAIEMIKDNCTPEKISRYLQMPLEWVQGLMKESVRIAK